MPDDHPPAPPTDPASTGQPVASSSPDAFGTGRPAAAATEGGAAKPRWERRKQDRPQEVIAAAFTLFVERGFAATRLEDVAARAGISKGTLYLYFASKEELFKAVVLASIVPVIDEAEALIDKAAGSSVELYRQIMLGWWQRLGATSRSGISKLIMAEAGNFPEIAAFYHVEVIERGRAMIRRLLERGMRAGEFRNVAIDSACNVLMAPMLMLIMWKHSFASCPAGAIDPHAYLESFLDLSLTGLLADGAAARG